MSGYNQEKISQLIRGLMLEIVNVRSKFQLWRHVQLSRNKHLTELNIAPGFFTLTLHSLFNDVIITLAKLYERGKEAASLNKLINIAENNKPLFDYKEDGEAFYMVTNQTIKDHKETIEEMKVHLDNLFTWRDKAYAHNDMKYFFDKEKLSTDAKLSMQNIEDLLKTAWEIVHYYSMALEGKAWYPDSPDTFDVDKLFSILSDYSQERRKDIDVYLTGMGLKINSEKEDLND